MAMFSKRHYEVIAQVMQSTYGHGWDAVRNELADAFRLDNHAFNEDRFFHACRPGANVKSRTEHLDYGRPRKLNRKHGALG